jgi:hypothetical protein
MLSDACFIILFQVQLNHITAPFCEFMMPYRINKADSSNIGCSVFFIETVELARSCEEGVSVTSFLLFCKYTNFLY